MTNMDISLDSYTDNSITITDDSSVAVVDERPKRVERGEKKYTEKTAQVNALGQVIQAVKFAGGDFLRVSGGYEPFTEKNFARIVYDILGAGVRRGAVSDLEHYFRTNTVDINHLSRYILMGDLVWDTRKVSFVEATEDIIYGAMFKTKYQPRIPEERYSNAFVMSLANNDVAVYDDIFQSIAPLILHTKPTGVIWWQGTGANGKSSLAKLIHKIFGEFLANLDLKSIEDERDTPVLNGKLGNVVLEASDHYVQNARLYKSVGAHEDFSIHKFHSQDMITVNGNIHHIFNCNNMPGFADKTDGARRRTLIVQFKNKFKDDPTFEKRTFTCKFIEEFLGEVILYAKEMAERGYTYMFSEGAIKAKDIYDEGANTAETFMIEMMTTDICGFMGFKGLYQIYENWCGENGYVPMKITGFRRTVSDLGFDRKSIRLDNGPRKVYMLDSVLPTEIELVRHTAGLYRRKGSPFVGVLQPLITEVNEEEIMDWVGTNG